jgi:hypothetical protein
MAALGTQVNFKRFELTQILVLSGEANFCGVKLNPRAQMLRNPFY